MKRWLQMLLVFLILTSFTIVIATFATEPIETFVNGDQPFAEATFVGPVNVSGMTKEEATKAIQKRVIEWNALETITVTYGETTIPFSNSKVLIDPALTVQTAKSGQLNPLYFAIDSSYLQVVLKDVAPDKTFDEQAVQKAIQSAIQGLVQTPINVVLNTYVASSAEESTSQTSGYLPIPAKLRSELSAFLKAKSSLEVKAEAQLSLNDVLKETGVKLSVATKEFIASAVYQAVLPTNFTVLERQPNAKLAPYIRPGFDVDLVEGVHDFIFYNPNDEPYTLTFSSNGQLFTATITGGAFPYSYDIDASKIETFKPRTVVQYSGTLASDEVVVRQEGTEGQQITVTKIVLEDGMEKERKTVAVDYYAPEYRIEVRGLYDPNAAENEKQVNEIEGETLFPVEE